MTAVSTESKVMDAKGQPVLKGSIVGIVDERSSWYPYQGLVVEPDSRMEGEEYTVAVYFHNEVHSSRFTFRGDDKSTLIEGWAKENKELLRRIVFFKPSDLVVHKEWKVETLVKRAFGNDNCHSLCGVKFPLIPGETPCFIKDCREKAVRKSLVNAQGAVGVFYVCESCFKDTHGKMTDSWPDLKEKLG